MSKGFSFSALRQSPQSPVALVPTGVCFLRRENKPDGADKSEDARAFAALTLEGLSPFPQEQLAWGVLDAPKQSYFWIVAALKERLAREGVQLSENDAYALPAFVPLCPLGFPKARQLFLWEKGTLTCLQIPANALWPSLIWRETLASPTAEAAFAARARLLENAQADRFEGETFAGVYTEISATAAPSGALSGSALRLESPQDAGTPVATAWPRKAEPLLWRADLRDDAFLAREGANRKKTLILWLAALGAVAAGALLLLWQGGLSLAERSLRARLERIETQKPLVDAIRQNQELLMKIERASGSELQPFLMLGLVNRARLANETTRNVYFVNMQADDLTQMTLQGKASSIAQVNAFVESLKKSGFLKSVELPDVKAKYTGADFTLKLDFKPLPAPQPRAENSPTEAAAK